MLMTYSCVGPLSLFFQSGWIPFKFLASQVYRVLKEKFQVCLPWGTCLGMILEGQTNSLSSEWIKPILGYPLPQTLHQLWGFLGITGFCRIWILGYADLHQLLKEAQQNSQSYLEWDRRVERLSKLSNRHSNYPQPRASLLRTVSNYMYMKR
jgi:hypothetical protein